jgi:nucleoside-diphosphate-sugar epimerase
MQLLAQQILGKKIEVSFEKQIDITDPKQRRPDLTRAKKILDYHPQISLMYGLEKTFLFFNKKDKNEN